VSSEKNFTWNQHFFAVHLKPACFNRTYGIHSVVAVQFVCVCAEIANGKESQPRERDAPMCAWLVEKRTRARQTGAGHGHQWCSQEQTRRSVLNSLLPAFLFTCNELLTFLDQTSFLSCELLSPCFLTVIVSR